MLRSFRWNPDLASLQIIKANTTDQEATTTTSPTVLHPHRRKLPAIWATFPPQAQLELHWAPWTFTILGITPPERPSVLARWCHSIQSTPPARSIASRRTWVARSLRLAHLVLMDTAVSSLSLPQKWAKVPCGSCERLGRQMWPNGLRFNTACKKNGPEIDMNMDVLIDLLCYVFIYLFVYLFNVFIYLWTLYDFNWFVYISIYSFGRQFYTKRFYYKWSRNQCPGSDEFEPLNCWVPVVDCIIIVNVNNGSVNLDSGTIICPAKKRLIYLLTSMNT